MSAGTFAEWLFTRAAPQGVDLTRSAKPKGSRASKKLSAKGRATRIAQRPAWSVAEVGQAAHGLPDVLFRCALYHYAMDQGQQWELWRHLVTRARQLQFENGWPSEILDVHGLAMEYTRHLALLVLYEDHYSDDFKLYGVRAKAWCLNCSERTWRAKLSGPYEDLRVVWMEWLSHARRHVQKRLREST